MGRIIVRGGAMFVVDGELNKGTVFAMELEKGAISQIRKLCGQKFAESSQIRIMPDAHAGNGCVVGATMTIKDKIVPNLVGVDICCGVESVNIGPADFDPAELDLVIRERVPSGFSIRNKPHPLAEGLRLQQLSCAESQALGKAAKSMGTLGGGNHFIEVDRDEKGNYWLVIHTGSRNIGLQVATHHQKLAREMHPELPFELAYLEGAAFDDYVHDLEIMRDFANHNRRAISEEIMEGMDWKEVDRFTTIHNYLDTESMILRKGAVSARKGERLIVPINMRDGSLLCEGLGNPEWNFSAPHGAGRLMSRREAKRQLSMDDFKSEMEGIYSTSVTENTLDEAPEAYKPLNSILEAIGDTARIVSFFKPVYNFKASVKPVGRKNKKAQE